MSPPPPSPETILKATPDGPITAYNPYTGTVLARYNGTQCPRNGITVIGNNQFASSHVSPETGAGSVNLYYWWSPSCARNIPLPEPVAPIAATDDGSYLFSGGISGRIHSVMVYSGEVIRSFYAHEKPVSCITISCDGSLILSGSDDGTIAVTPVIMLLDCSADKKQTNVTSKISPITELLLVSENSEIKTNISSVPGDREAAFPNSCIHEKSKKFKRFVGHELAVTGLTTGVGRSDGIMISSSLDRTCKVWTVNGTHLRTVKFPGEIWCMVMDPFGTEFYAAGKDRVIYKRKLKAETRKQAAQGGETVVWGGVHDGPVVAMVMLNYGGTLLTVCENGVIYAWEVDSGRMIGGFIEKIGGGVSGVVVVKCGGGFGTRGIEGGESGGCDDGKVAGKAVMEVAEMTDALNVVVDERRRAISNFESAIEINEKLLNLMLKEANAISKLDECKPNTNHMLI